MKKLFAYIGFLLLVSSCQVTEFRGMELSLGNPVKITSFSVNGSNGLINEKAGNIALELPFGTDFESVKPAVAVSEGAQVSPASGETINLRKAAKYRVTHGNLFNEYTVLATEKKALLSFVVAGVAAVIDEQARTIYAVVPDNVSIRSLAPAIELAGGASVSPAPGVAADFTQPVDYTVSSGGISVKYRVTIVTLSSVAKLAFIGTAASANAITSPDEKAAFEWMSASFPNVDFISFNAVKANTVDLSRYKLIWWHQDVTQSLPSIAFDLEVISRLKAFRAGGGAFLLTSYGAQYLEALGVVPAGKGPNNVFGDNTPWIETSWDWGISFKSAGSHPVFQGLTLTSDKPFPTAYLLAKNTYRLNHSAVWKVNEWGGYGSIANWRSETGGIDLASTEWDEDHVNHVTIAEFPRKAGSGPVISIGAGAYDWHVDANPENGSPGNPNAFKPNVERLTRNSIQYLTN